LISSDTVAEAAFIPHESRTRSPVTPGGARKSPDNEDGKALLSPVIPVYSRRARSYQDRHVTPEVAGSSPVAPPLAMPSCGSESRIRRIRASICARLGADAPKNLTLSPWPTTPSHPIDSAAPHDDSGVARAAFLLPRTHVHEILMTAYCASSNAFRGVGRFESCPVRSITR